MRLASVFAGQTRTNQPSCATASAAGTPISSAIRDAKKDARIRSPALLSHTDYLPQTSRARQPGHHQRLHYPESGRLDSDQGGRDGAGTLIVRNAGDEG